METQIDKRPDIHPLRATAWLTQAVMLGSLPLFFLQFMLPIYSRSLGASAVEIGGLYTVLAVAVLILRPIAGWGLDRIGRKPFLVAALAVHVVALGLFAAARDMLGLYAAQVADGISTAMMWITVYTMAADLAGDESRGRMMGRVREAPVRGSLMGAFIGFPLINMLPGLFEAISESEAWSIVFGVYGVLGIASVALATWKVPETRPAGAGRTGQPRQPFSPLITRLLVIVFLTNLSLAMLSPIYLIFIQDRFTSDILTLSMAFLPSGIVAGFLPSRLGGLSDRFGRTPMMAIGLILSAVVSMLLPKLSALLPVVVLFTVEQVGWSTANPAEAAMVVDFVGQNVRGMGYAIYTLVIWGAHALGPLMGGWLYDSVGEVMPFYLNGGMLVVGAVLVLVLLNAGVLKNSMTK